ncbi:MAG: hypothetical protein ABJ327_13150 [Litoreibacter sp.]
MILSDAHQMAFLHNPKVGGTSIRATIEHLHDGDTIFWSTDSERDGPPLDRAHLGLDEIADHYPDIWSRMQGYRLFSLYRDPFGRFFSSLAEFSKLHGDVDTRFAETSDRKRALMEMRDRLEALGQAEAVMDHYELRHFRPQWIYWHAQTAPNAAELDVVSLPVEQISALFDAISERTGQPLTEQTRNRGDQLDLPGPLARLAGHRGIKDTLKRLPGADHLKALLRGRYTVKTSSTDRYGLSPDEADDLHAFVDKFYAQDLARWPDHEAGSGLLASRASG